MQNNQIAAQTEVQNIELLANNFELSELETRTELGWGVSVSCPIGSFEAYCN